MMSTFVSAAVTLAPNDTRGLSWRRNDFRPCSDSCWTSVWYQCYHRHSRYSARRTSPLHRASHLNLKSCDPLCRQVGSLVLQCLHSLEEVHENCQLRRRWTRRTKSDSSGLGLMPESYEWRWLCCGCACRPEHGVHKLQIWAMAG